MIVDEGETIPLLLDKCDNPFSSEESNEADKDNNN